ncbi:C-type lectin domain family 6 member A [Biomphalaria glabrata]|uniref:Uncharacterized protein LOC106077847 n=1 Tax=Biomphalaria glabrata TaxID=6526 RepID=A0A9U8ELS6_BIOGL|nr:uncharacterized protein LOC106077847 [Biomphalaria glabrata]KAI8727932.1 C-type lectin domain family 6 member A-like [Biomphalaria glabrata]
MKTLVCTVCLLLLSVAHSQQINCSWALNNFRKAYFKASSCFNNTTYLLSKEDIFYYPSFGQAMCALAGGYLAEINTKQELDYVKNFVASQGFGFWAVMLGGTDEVQEGKWVNRYSGTPVVPFWYRTEPDDTIHQQNCQCMFKPYSWELGDIACVYNSKQDVGFLCEVESVN